MKCPQCGYQAAESEIRCPRCRKHLLCGGCSGNCLRCAKEKETKDN